MFKDKKLREEVDQLREEIVKIKKFLPLKTVIEVPNYSKFIEKEWRNLIEFLEYWKNDILKLRETEKEIKRLDEKIDAKLDFIDVHKINSIKTITADLRVCINALLKHLNLEYVFLNGRWSIEELEVPKVQKVVCKRKRKAGKKK